MLIFTHIFGWTRGDEEDGRTTLKGLNVNSRGQGNDAGSRRPRMVTHEAGDPEGVEPE
jgi:hypothetical protein